MATKYPIVAGIMTFASVVLCILIGIWVLATSVTDPYADPRMNIDINISTLKSGGNGTIIVYKGGNPALSPNGLLIGTCSLITTGFGLATAYLTFRKEHYRLAILGTSLIVLTSVALSLFIHQGWVVGIPTLLIAVLSMAFVTFSRSEFR